MKYKRYLFAIMIIVLFFSSFVIIYGKINLKHIDYNYYINNSMYSFDQKDDYKNMFKNSEKIFTEDLDINKVINFSDYILVVKNIKNPIMYGEGIINICEVKKVLKGNNLKANDLIKIYDLEYYWADFSTDYLDGSTPLKKNEEYLVFIKKTPQPSMNDTYVFSSTKYGHININNHKYLKDYENYTKPIKTISNYDYVFSKNYLLYDVEQYEKNVNFSLNKYIK